MTAEGPELASRLEGSLSQELLLECQARACGTLGVRVGSVTEASARTPSHRTAAATRLEEV